MRPKIKQMIDLIETEGWVFSDSPPSSKCKLSFYSYRPQGQSYPAISWFGIWMDEDCNISLEDDEKAYISVIFDRRRNNIEQARQKMANRRLDHWLMTRRSL